MSNFDWIPPKLQKQRSWCVWRIKSQPTSPVTNRRIEWQNNPGTFEEATTFCKLKSNFKLGYMFTPETEVFGIDFDSCRNPETGEIESWAKSIIDRFRTYTEISESKTGVKLIGIGKAEHRTVEFSEEPQYGNHKPHFEVFSDSKYFALTGDVLDGFTKLEHCQTQLDELVATLSDREFTGVDRPSLVQRESKKLTVTEDVGIAKTKVDDFNRRNPIAQILRKHGYEFDSKGRPVRPGKNPKDGCSGVINVDTNRVIFYSSNCKPFEQSFSGEGNGTTYDAWSCHVLLNFNGDFTAAYQHEFGNGTLKLTPASPKTSDIEPVDPETVLQYQPFPTDSLPRCASKFVRSVAEIIDCADASVALPLLSGMAASIGNLHRLYLNETYSVPPIIWTVSIAKSGSAKSPPWKRVRDLFTPYDEMWHHEFTEAKKEFVIQEKVYKKNFSKWKTGPMPTAPERPRQRRILTDDVTIEGLGQLHTHNPKGLFVCVDELAGLISGFDQYSGAKGAEVNKWLSLHGGGSLMQDRKSVQSIYVPKTSVSIAGTIQPARFFKTIGTDNLAAGLAARFAAACPPDRIRKLNLKPSADSSRDLEAVVKVFMDKEVSLDKNNVVESGSIYADQIALEFYQEFFHEKQKQIFEYEDGFGAAISKLADVALRLALIFHLFKNPSGGGEVNISLATFHDAVTVAEFFIHEAKRLYLGGDGQTGSLCRQILETLSVNKGERLSVRDLKHRRRAFRKIRSEEIDRACIELVSLQRIVSAKEGTRKPKIVYFVPMDQTKTFKI